MTVVAITIARIKVVMIAVGIIDWPFEMKGFILKLSDLKQA